MSNCTKSTRLSVGQARPVQKKTNAALDGGSLTKRNREKKVGEEARWEGGRLSNQKRRKKQKRQKTLGHRGDNSEMFRVKTRETSKEAAWTFREKTLVEKTWYVLRP